jgi:regulatory protein
MSTERVAELERAQSQLMGLLKVRPRSKYEVRMRLRQRGISQDIIQQVIALAEDKGLLDDELFAKLWIEERMISKPKGRQALEQELREKGIDREIISQLLNRQEMDEFPLAKQLAEERLQRHAHEAVETQKRKLGAFLKRRGFSFAIINKVLREVFH